jgi:hypothetical protein
MKNSKNLTKNGKNGKNWKYQKLPMKFIEKKKKALTRLRLYLASECTFQPKKMTKNWLYRGILLEKIHQNFKKS